MPSPRPAPRQRGVSLIEALMVLAITALLAASAAPGMQALIAARRLERTASQLATDIQLVRATAVARNEALRLSLHTIGSGSCYVIHTGAANQCLCGESGPALCNGGAQQLKTVSVSSSDQLGITGSSRSLLFDPMHGTVSPTGTLQVTGASGRAIHHVVNVMGRVRSCSPAPAVAGYRAC